MRQFRLCVLLSVISLSQCSSKCAESSPYFTCNGATVIVIDGTHHMRSYTEVDKEISYIENHVIPRLGLGKDFKAAFMLSGTRDHEKWERKYASSPKEACSELQSLDDVARKNSLGKESLKKILQRIVNEHFEFHHPFIFFSKSDDKDEISEAAEYARMYVRNEITVVALGGKASAWRNFPAVSVFAIEVDNLDSSKNLSYCIAERTCSITNESSKCAESSPYCNCNGATVIVIDGTHHMHSYTEIDKEISYIENHVIPRLGLGKDFKAAFMLSGTRDHEKILQRIVNEHFEFHHPLILFSKSDDKDEISEAAEYARMYVRNEITVVALSGKASAWRNFPAVSVFAIEVGNLDSSKNLGYCIAERTCSITNE
ncbi:unnamed protein product [Strongylus vulgaris]|uniref:VWFA domain-containing protein n=1 Tax=Strongylus vulgaris TaxID=40348 RepID=A0A3P7J1Z6_STRVU|nr:unnamed protein product [Strongylus vulgaris]